jgi:hypothetical protein
MADFRSVPPVQVQNLRAHFIRFPWEMIDHTAGLAKLAEELPVAHRLHFPRGSNQGFEQRQIGSVVTTSCQQVDLVHFHRVRIPEVAREGGEAAANTLRAQSAMSMQLSPVERVDAAHGVFDQVAAPSRANEIDDLCLGIPNERVLQAKLLLKE